jgi:excisionase family DNA binding protein
MDLETSIRELVRSVVREELGPLREELRTLATMLPPLHPPKGAGDLLSVEDVAKRLKVSQATVRDWIKSGALNAQATLHRREARAHLSDRTVRPRPLPRGLPRTGPGDGRHQGRGSADHRETPPQEEPLTGSSIAASLTHSAYSHPVRTGRSPATGALSVGDPKASRLGRRTSPWREWDTIGHHRASPSAHFEDRRLHRQRGSALGGHVRFPRSGGKSAAHS